MRPNRIGDRSGTIGGHGGRSQLYSTNAWTLMPMIAQTSDRICCRTTRSTTTGNPGCCGFSHARKQSQCRCTGK